MFFPLLAPWLRPAVPLLMDSAIARDSLASRTLLLSVSEQLLRAAKEGGGQGPAQSGSFFDIMHRVRGGAAVGGDGTLPRGGHVVHATSCVARHAACGVTRHACPHACPCSRARTASSP